LRFELAGHYYKKGKFEEAIDHSLDSIAIDRNWNDQKAYKLLLEIFKELGNSNELVLAG